VYYSQKNRFGAAYSLYKEMTSRFAVEPDSATLSIMVPRIVDDSIRR
jgi:pentatricopeptide repeat protein